MPSYYTVQTFNKFSCLDDEDGSETERVNSEAPKVAAAVADKADEGSPKPKKKPVGQPMSSQAQPPKQDGQYPRGTDSRPARGGERRGGGMGGGRGAFRGGAPRSTGEEQVVDDKKDGEERTPTFRRGGGARGGRGGGGGGGFARNAPRDGDRHVSGTGRGRELKKGGGGGHNWGATDGQEGFGGAQKTPGGGSNEPNWGETGTPKDDSPVSTEEKAETQNTKPEEEVQLDVNEYRRIQEAKRANLPKLPSGPARSVSGRDLEKDGYAKYIPNGAKEGSEDGSDDVDEKRKRKEAKTPKNMNIFEYAEKSGVRMFSDRRRRGRGGRGDEERRPARDIPARCYVAPLHNIDLSEEEFPTLGCPVDTR